MEGYNNLRHSAQMLGIKVRTLRQWIRDNKVKAVKYPNCNMWFISTEEIRRIQNGGEG